MRFDNLNTYFVTFFVDISRLTSLTMKVYTIFMRKILFWATMMLIVILYLGLSFLGAPIIKLTPSQDQVSDLQARVDILKSLTEAIAIVIAGVWTYELYIKNRYEHPYPKIQHRIEHYDLKNGMVYLSVFVTVTNEGKTKLDLGSGKISIRQVFPVPEQIKKILHEAIKRSEEIRLGISRGLFTDSGQRLGWITLGLREWSQLRGKMKELEPGQTREIQFDFLIENEVKIIEAISYIEYARSSWESATIYSLTSTKTLKKSG